HHEPSITAAVDNQAIAIYTRLVFEPVSGMGQVGHRVHPFSYVVQMAVRFAVTCRTAHVRGEHSITVTQEVLREEVEEGPGLGFWPTMHHYYDRQWGGYRFVAIAWRFVEPGRDQACNAAFVTVESWVMDEFRSHKRSGWKTTMRRPGNG